MEGQIIADVLQKGGKLHGAAQVLNRWKVSNGMTHVAVSTIKHHVDTFMKAKRNKTQKVPSGNNNPYSPWARASFRFAKQLAIRYGKLNPFTTADPIMPPPPPEVDKRWIDLYHREEEEDRKRMNLLVEEENTRQMQQSFNSPLGPSLPILLPSYDATKPFPIVLPEYDPDNLTPIGPYQHADWDKTHPKAKIGVTMKGNRPFEYRFARDSQGKIDNSNSGSYLDCSPPTRTVPKYESESRFLFGVATVKLLNGEVIGRRMAPFCYTGRKILSHKDWQNQVRQEID